MSRNPHVGRLARQDLRQDLKNARFARAFHRIKAKISMRQKLKMVAEKEGIGVRELARRMGTSPAQVIRLFSSPSESWRLDTLIRFGAAVGKTLNISFK